MIKYFKYFLYGFFILIISNIILAQSAKVQLSNIPILTPTPAPTPLNTVTPQVILIPPTAATVAIDWTSWFIRIVTLALNIGIISWGLWSIRSIIKDEVTKSREVIIGALEKHNESVLSHPTSPIIVAVKDATLEARRALYDHATEETAMFKEYNKEAKTEREQLKTTVMAAIATVEKQLNDQNTTRGQLEGKITVLLDVFSDVRTELSRIRQSSDSIKK